MTPGEMIEQLAGRAYANGVDPVKFTIAVIEVVTEEIFDLPCHDPRTVLLSRKLVACLLEAGWQVPDGTETP
jgi:hypothetical protein